MSASKNNLLIAILTAVLVFGMAARTPLDTDLFWHLRAGEEMLVSGHPLLIDGMSYTRLGTPWVNHSWLSEVILALLFRAGGFAALGLWMAVIVCAVMILIYFRLTGPPIWRAFLIVFVSVVIAPVWSPRPQLFSLLMIVVLDILLDTWRKGRIRGWWIAALMALWSNLHGGYALGLILLACWVGGELLNHLLGREDALAGSRILRLVGWGLLGFLAVAINPNGIAMWRIPFQTVDVGVLQQSIEEWASPDFHQMYQQPFLLFLAGLIMSLGLSGKAVDGKALVKCTIFAGMALIARRNIGPFAVLTAPLLAETAWPLFSKMLERLPRLRESQPIPLRLAKAINLFLVALLTLTVLGKWYAVSNNITVQAYTAQSYPVAGVNWLKQAKPPGRMLSDYAWGGYLDWALPEYPVFVDGRADLFGSALIGDWYTAMYARDGWQQVLDQWDVRLVMLGQGAPLLRELPRTGWKLVYQDPVALIYAR